MLLGGKTEFIIQLIENRQKLFKSEFSRIIFCQSESLAHWQNQAYQRIKASFQEPNLSMDFQMCQN